MECNAHCNEALCNKGGENKLPYTTADIEIDPAKRSMGLEASNFDPRACGAHAPLMGERVWGQGVGSILMISNLCFGALGVTL